MDTVEEIARDLLGSLAADAGVPTAAKWIGNRYKELVSRVRFRHLREIGELQMPAEVTAGTVSATRDSTTVTPNATAQAAWLTSPGVASHEYWYIKISSAWYKVASVDALAATLTLATAFSEDDVSAGSYSLVKRYHALDSNARWLGQFIHTRLRVPLDGPMPHEAFEIRYPGRTLTGHFPLAVAQVGVDSNNYPMVEIYPPPDESEIIHYVFWNLPTALTISSTIPAQIDGYILKEGSLIDAYRYEKARARRAGSFEEANSWRNDEFAQMTKWENFIQQAIRTDRGADDITMILQMFGSANRIGTGDYPVDAHDYVTNRWSWPSLV
jgi:hypothetical protein